MTKIITKGFRNHGIFIILSETKPCLDFYEKMAEQTTTVYTFSCSIAEFHLLVKTK